MLLTGAAVWPPAHPGRDGACSQEPSLHGCTCRDPLTPRPRPAGESALLGRAQNRHLQRPSPHTPAPPGRWACALERAQNRHLQSSPPCTVESASARGFISVEGGGPSRCHTAVHERACGWLYPACRLFLSPLCSQSGAAACVWMPAAPGGGGPLLRAQPWLCAWAMPLMRGGSHMKGLGRWVRGSWADTPRRQGVGRHFHSEQAAAAAAAS